MIVQRLFSRRYGNKTNRQNYPILYDRKEDVNVKEDNPDFDKHLSNKVKNDKFARRVAQVGIPLTIGTIIGAKSRASLKGSIKGAALGAATGYGVGRTYDKATRFDEKQRGAEKSVSENYKILPHRGYYGQNEREKYRQKYLNPNKNLKDIK